jgi:DNA-binding response OmpR family regulator
MQFRILVVDDEPILRDSLEVALKTSGYFNSRKIRKKEYLICAGSVRV